MKKLVMLIPALVLGACTMVGPVPADIKAAVDKIPNEQLPEYPALEQQKCGHHKGIYMTRSSKGLCINAVRRHETELKMMQESGVE